MEFLLLISILVVLSSNVAMGFNFLQMGPGVMVGKLENYSHDISGTVYAINEKTLVVKGFTYDGTGPDAFFWVGTEGSPSRNGIILPYPFEGKFFEYNDKSAPILEGRFTGDEDIKLTLPDTLKATDIKWMSVWCRKFEANFGDLLFRDGLSLPDDTPEGSGSMHAEGEPLSKPEDEPSPNGSNPFNCTNLMILATTVVFMFLM